MGRESAAIVVLGCALPPLVDGALGGAAGRRAREGARAFGKRAGKATHKGELLVVASGGRAWNGVIEAEGLALELERCGVPADRIVRERLSLSTRDNARFVAAMLRPRSIDRVVVVTCSWHMARAAALFRREGLDVEACPAAAPPAPLATRLWRWGRERVAARLAGVRT